MDKALKALLNSLRCPVCGGQIDILDGRSLAPRSACNYACRSDNIHYRILIPDTDYIFFKVNEEQVIVYEGKHKYEVHQLHEINMTYINIYEVDIENNIKSPIPKHFNFPKLLFNFPKTNRVKLVNRIKTILVFQ